MTLFKKLQSLIDKQQPVENLHPGKIADLPDPLRFPALRLARAVMATGGLAGAAFNAAKEVALDGFIAQRLRFPDMAAVVEATLDRLSADRGLTIAPSRLDDVLAMDHLARQTAGAIVQASRT